jgi:hypothetical protein
MYFLTARDLFSRRTLRRGRALKLVLTCLRIGARTRILDAWQGFVLALVGIPPSERLIRNTIGPHFVFPKRPDFGARRLTAEPIRCANRPAEFNAGRGRDEVYSLASIAHDTHMDRHTSGLCHDYPGCRLQFSGATIEAGYELGGKGGQA